MPLSNFRYSMSISTLDGVALLVAEQDRLSAQLRVVTPDDFRTLQIPIARGMLVFPLTAPALEPLT